MNPALIFLHKFNLLSADLDVKSKWNILDQYNIPVTEEEKVKHITPYPTGKSPEEFLVSYGIANGGQSYGGSTIVLQVNESKPCHVPVYGSYNEKISGILTVYNEFLDESKNIV